MKKMFQKLIKNKFFWPLITFVLIFPAIVSLLPRGDYFNMHDDMQLIRQLEFEKCLLDGQIPCRWTPDLGFGYGYPLFNFYPPLPYAFGQVFRVLGLSFITTAKLTFASQIIFSGMSMYLLGASLFGGIGGLLAAVFYTYAPYHAVNIFVRGAMNEAWAGVFFPLIFLFSKRVIENTKKMDMVLLGLSFSGMMLSHNPMVITFTPYFALWCFYFLYSKYKLVIKDLIKPTLSLIYSGILAFTLSAFFSIPVLFESKLVQIESMFQNYYHYSVHFVSIKQLFISLFWGDGPSTWMTDDGMSFMIGYFHWILPIVALIISVYIFVKNKKDAKQLIPIFGIIILGFFTAFMTHEKSTFLWKLFPVIQKIQFPWRFLSHTAFLLSLSVSSLYFILSSIISKKYDLYKNILVTLIVVLSIGFNLKYFKPVTHGPINDEQKFSGQAWTNQITSGIYDYLPKTASTAAKKAASDYVDFITPNTATFNISNGKKGTDWQMFDIKLSQDAQVTTSVLAFPKFVVSVNNKEIDYTIEPELGRITFPLSAGEHHIYIKFTNTPVRTVSNIISLFAWSFILGFFINNLWKKLILKK